MTNLLISTENVSKPDFLLRALQSSTVTVQVHRKNTCWDYLALAAAHAKLSPTGFQLYMYLERQSTQAPWCVWPKKVLEETALTEFSMPGAVMELQKRGYLTPGKIEPDGSTYEVNVFHFWEHPELCNINYKATAA